MSNVIPYDHQALPTRRFLEHQIDNLPIAAEAKLTLHRLGKLTATAGGQVVEIGRRIIAFAFELMRQFPSLALALAAALTINALLISIPLLGPFLQPVFGPLILATGISVGALAELWDGDMRPKMDALITEFQAIFG